MNNIRPETFEKAADIIEAADQTNYTCIAISYSGSNEEMYLWRDCHFKPRPAWFIATDYSDRRILREQLLREMAFNLRAHGYE